MKQFVLFIVMLFVMGCGEESTSPRPQEFNKTTPVLAPSAKAQDVVVQQQPVPAVSSVEPVVVQSVSQQAVQTTAVQSPPVVLREHEVQQGEWLRLIADHYRVGWEAMLLANEDFLKKKYGEICPKFPAEIKGKPKRKGLFCNDKYKRPYGNTLMPGWKLKIPAAEAPASIDRVVHNMAGKSVALVIDETGSMGEDRRQVGEFYLAAIKAHGKRITGVWLFADGQIRRYHGGGVLELNTHGQFENTHNALRHAAKDRPEGIILVTDEPGDDWDWSTVNTLPPVVAHCLYEGRHGAGNYGTGYTCETNLQKLANTTHGQYVSDL